MLIYGFPGVETFFLISGFVILMSGWGRTVREFAASRAARLYPAFWASVVITTVVTAVLSITGGLPFSSQSDTGDVLINMTMLAEPLNTPLVDTVYWTLWVELRFYLLTACLLAAGFTRRVAQKPARELLERIVSTDRQAGREPAPSRRRAPRLAIAGVASTVAAAGAFALALASIGPAYASWTPDPSPLPAAEVRKIVDKCLPAREVATARVVIGGKRGAYAYLNAVWPMEAGRASSTTTETSPRPAS
uniref:acyltransferase family protein n=1 Tax=Paractinoplanes polyasparticus TaxID=2856853 RepID=UPI0027E064BB|nr:acyltransferase family protein [Actinoplanes polyasparticus]